MKKQIKDPKKGEKFKFNDTIYTVKQKYADWKKNGEPYLATLCGLKFEFDELEVDTIKNKKS